LNGKAVAGQPVWVDCFSSLFQYLGVKTALPAGDMLTFWRYPNTRVKVFRCPSDPSWDGDQPGYKILTNVESSAIAVLSSQLTAVNTTTYYPVSYGINGDIACLNERANNGNLGNAVYGPNDGILKVWNPSVTATTTTFPSADAILSQVHHSESVMLFADCGIRPPNLTYPQPYPWDKSDCLLYTSNNIGGGTMDWAYGTNLNSDPTKVYLKYRIPVLRHDNRINISFCDGHAETVPVGGFNKVWISPWQPK
jgi:prepilin-type processing-associated H-X9-DG protein